MEEREPEAEMKALSLTAEFSKSFHFICHTSHPSNLANEYPSKGANLAWASRKLSERYEPSTRDKVLITVLDGIQIVLANPF